MGALRAFGPGVDEPPGTLTVERKDYANRRAALEARLPDLMDKREKIVGIDAQLAFPPKLGAVARGRQ
jgi:hypothetical protein